MFIRLYEAGWEDQTDRHYCYFDKDYIYSVKPVLVVESEDEYGLEHHKEVANECLVTFKNGKTMEVNMGVQEFVSKYLKVDKGRTGNPFDIDEELMDDCPFN